MIKIILADDQTLIREGLLMVLEQVEDFNIIGVAANGEEVVDLLIKEKPDVIVTDIQMPKMDGVEVAKEVKRHFPEIKIVGLTMFTEDHYVVDMLEAGADGYLLKTSEKEKLIEAIRAVHGNGRYFCETTSTKLIQKIAGSKIEISNKEDAEQFTETEKKIIQLICEQLSSKEIGERLHLGLTTVESYRNKIYSKIGVRNMAGLAIHAIRCGLFKP